MKRLPATNKQGVPHLHIIDEEPKIADQIMHHIPEGVFNPLKHGMKNVGKNIGVELAAGKPRKQAIAIAYSVARGRKDYH